VTAHLGAELPYRVWCVTRHGEVNDRAPVGRPSSQVNSRPPGKSSLSFQSGGAADRLSPRGLVAQDVDQSDRRSVQGSQQRGADPSDEQLQTISVIVATRHRASLLEPLIAAVLSDPGALELIVVIDGLDDFESLSTLSKLGDFDGRLSYFCTPQGGQFIALQRGVAAAKGELVLLLDDDVLPTSPLASGHARRHGSRDDLVVVGSMPVSNTAPLGVATRIYSESYNEHCRSILETNLAVLDYLWGGNFSLRRDRCLDVGINSPSFVAHYHADRDFGYRLSNAGLSGVFEPSLRAVHLHSRSPEAFLRDAGRQGVGIELLHRLHPERLEPFSPRQLFDTVPYPIYLIFRTISWTRTSGAASRLFIGLGLLAGRFHLDAVETFFAKMAQHLMQLHGVRMGRVR